MDPNFGRPTLTAAVPADTKILTSDYTDEELDKAIHQTICPLDSFTADGVYWADLPFKKRMQWIKQQSDSEASREAKEIWSTFREDPLEPLRQYYRHYVVNGALALFPALR